MTTLEDIGLSIDVAARPAKVWAVLTGEGQVEKWLGCVGYRARPGADFYMQPDAARRKKGDIAGATHCEVLALEAPERFAFSWFLPGTPKTLVEIVVTPAASGSRVSLMHSGWDQFDPGEVAAVRDSLEAGWRSAVLPQLKAAAEG
ncbi:MAG TPA: SRPBCC domain-containing protein [Caulobacteraceae bacterium]|jgi:uncharacterized protein YndB with AHSA1/START domain|nr:SRPBCC domain-containing protein [Caulobacteraceae bacterium]